MLSGAIAIPKVDNKESQMTAYELSGFYAIIVSCQSRSVYALTFCLALFRKKPAPALKASTPNIVVGSGTGVNR